MISMREVLGAVLLAAGFVGSLVMLSCAMLSSRLSQAEERAEAAKQVTVKNKNLVYNREQEDEQP